MQIPNGNALYNIAGGSVGNPDLRPAPGAPENVRQARASSAAGPVAEQSRKPAEPPASADKGQPYYPAPRGTHLDIVV